jgi:hypothetical protein
MQAIISVVLRADGANGPTTADVTWPDGTHQQVRSGHGTAGHPAGSHSGRQVGAHFRGGRMTSRSLFDLDAVDPVLEPTLDRAG